MTQEDQNDFRMEIISAAMSGDYKTAYRNASIYIQVLEKLVDKLIEKK